MVFHLSISFSFNLFLFLFRSGHVQPKETKNVTYFLKICGWSKKILININRLNNIIRFGIENAIK
jgi:hypothetical protein